MRWEELKTPEAVLAAFAARLRVEFTCEPDGWIVPTQNGRFEPEVMMRMGCRYRALIKEPAIPAGYTPWGGGECPKDALGRKVSFIMRGMPSVEQAITDDADDLRWDHEGGGADIIAYRVEQAQPSQQGDAVYQLTSADPDTGGWFDVSELAYRAKTAEGRKGRILYLPIPAEPLGRDAEGQYTDANPFDGGSLTTMAARRDADGVEWLSASELAAWGYESITDRPPPRNATVVYWHRQEDGPGFPAIADEWRDEHHAAHAVAWHPQASGLARRLRPHADGDRALPAFSPMWLAPLDGSPVMLYMPTSSDKFGVGKWHGSMHSTDGVWVDEDDRIFTHTPAGFMALSNLERLTAALTEAGHE